MQTKPICLGVKRDNKCLALRAGDSRPTGSEGILYHTTAGPEARFPHPSTS